MRVAVFGLGKFGRHVAIELAQAGHDVLAMDQREDLVQSVKEQVSDAVVGDATNRSVLESLGVEKADAAVVSLGCQMAGSILLTMFLKELKIKKVMVKALDDAHAMVLKKVGADQVVFPEREMASRLAKSLAIPNLTEFLPLGPGLAIAQIQVPEELGGRSLKELDLRRRHGLQVLAVKRNHGSAIDVIIDPETIIEPGTTIYVLGRTESIDKLRLLT